LRRGSLTTMALTSARRFRHNQPAIGPSSMTIEHGRGTALSTSIKAGMVVAQRSRLTTFAAESSTATSQNWQ
jgi:hypothetical protein